VRYRRLYGDGFAHKSDNIQEEDPQQALVLLVPAIEYHGDLSYSRLFQSSGRNEKTGVESACRPLEKALGTTG